MLLFYIKLPDSVLCKFSATIEPIQQDFYLLHFNFYNFHLFFKIISILRAQIFYFLICYKKIFKSIFIISVLKFLLDNSNIWLLSVLGLVNYVFSFKLIFLVLDVMDDFFLLYTGHFACYVKRLESSM